MDEFSCASDEPFTRHTGSHRSLDCRTDRKADCAAPRSRRACGIEGKAGSRSARARHARPGACAPCVSGPRYSFPGHQHEAVGARLLFRHQVLRLLRPGCTALHVHPNLSVAFDAAHLPKEGPELGHGHVEEAREAADHRHSGPVGRLGCPSVDQRGQVCRPAPLIEEVRICRSR